uniref:DUF6824 domain-containing protein n=1 Tax=Entomoneis paludosa TaxID=265537 RepID=A0A7S3DQD2_9STRA|eukprot:CAMPEP_0172442898 /NCGR_PEP_ID=MMETSP1065-20121228/3251_1 /TAXON_ID=265537 /ORGANISM="Amphiprora paludosa, Strain CCMP125" /LENGTH=465 /DNA_ID=CAMNT_0013192943 /DNA_START=305 /DNA_END=1702 /DNA_ORIENTATION=+
MTDDNSEHSGDAASTAAAEAEETASQSEPEEASAKPTEAVAAAAKKGDDDNEEEEEEEEEDSKSDAKSVDSQQQLAQDQYPPHDKNDHMMMLLNKNKSNKPKPQNPSSANSNMKRTHTAIFKRKGESQPLKDIETPEDTDVLSGRGNFVNYHPGNLMFRELVQKHKLAYVACPKPQKSGFAELIVADLRAQGARFLCRNESTKLWHDIGDKKALMKTRQALREGAPDIAERLTTPRQPGMAHAAAAAAAARPVSQTHATLLAMAKHREKQEEAKRKADGGNDGADSANKKHKSDGRGPPNLHVLSEVADLDQSQALNVLSDVATVRGGGGMPPGIPPSYAAALYPFGAPPNAGFPYGYPMAPSPFAAPPSAAALLMQHPDPRLAAAEARLAAAEARLAAAAAADPRLLATPGMPPGMGGLYPYAMPPPMAAAQQQHSLALLQAAAAQPRDPQEAASGTPAPSATA